jgi:hypothetical protein
LNLDTDLMELAITAFLRTLVAKHRADVPGFCTGLPPVMPCSSTARTQAAVPSGRRVRSRVAVVEGVFSVRVGHFTDKSA